MASRITRTFAVALAAGSALSAASAQSIATLPPNNGSGGVFLQLTPAAGPLTVTSFSSYFSSAAGTPVSVEVWTRPGAYAGFTLSNAGWTLSETVVGTSAGTVTESGPVVLANPIVIPSGGPTSIYLHAITAGGGIRYQGTGTTSTGTFINADVTLFSNISITGAVPFAASQFTPRAFSGTINYALGGTLGACCLTSGASNCVVTTSGGCTTLGGTYQGDGSDCGTANCPPLPTGACCRNDGTCDVVTQNDCTTTGGTYAGDGVTCAAANCPAAGACCFFSSCSSLTEAACTAQGGTWQGAATVCGSCPTPHAETGDAGDLPGTAEVVSGSGTLIGISGTLGTSDTDMYRINVCDAANFSATTLGLTTVDTQLFMFNTNGTGLTHNDDTPPGTLGLQSTIGNSIVGPAGNGEYYIAVSQYNKDPNGATTAGLMWINTPFNTERAPDGPAAAEAIGSWTTITGTGGAYGLQLSGACYVGGGCYANCDGSVGNPLLTANDFSCFLNKYVNGDTYADCDGVGGLTANDFSCFLGKYVAGCT